MPVDPAGRRRHTTESGCATEAAAAAALRELISVLATDVTTSSTTVSDHLDTWLLGEHSLRVSTLTACTSLVETSLRPRLGAEVRGGARPARPP